jgi:hypothetical protein
MAQGVSASGGFGGIPRRKTFNSKAKATSIAGKLYAEAMEMTRITNRGRVPAVRPSSFPLCPILVWQKMLKGASLGEFREEETAAGHYFTKVGTTAHENIQYWMGMNGKMYGHWRCINRGCAEFPSTVDLFDKTGKMIQRGKNTLENTTQHECPCCLEPMEYIELEIVYRGIKGHVDGVIMMDDGGVWVIDYKTTTRTKIDSGKLPERVHLKQLPAYSYILKQRYGLNVTGFSLLYFTRDNPYNFLDASFPWNKSWDLKAKAILSNESKKYIAALDDFTTKSISEIIRAKPCTDKYFYNTEMSPYAACPHAASGDCFNKKKLKKVLKAFAQEYPYSRKKAIAITAGAFPRFIKKRGL